MTRIDIGQHETLVTGDGGSIAPEASSVHRLGVGYLRVGRRPFRYEPPGPQELEQAIALVEDAVMPLSGSLARGVTLLAVGDGAAILASALAGASREREGSDAGAGLVLSLDEVEGLFQRVVEVSEGSPLAGAGVPVDGGFVATLLILREFMHHLGYGSVGIAIGAGVPAARDSAPGD